MRAIVNISLPPQMNDLIENEVLSGKFATKSEFIRSLLRSWSEEKLERDLEESSNELKFGKGKLLKSLKDFR